MVLSSQQSRSSGGRSSYMYARRRRRNRGWIVAVIVVLAVAIPAYIYWPWGGSGDQDANNGATDGTDSRLAANTETGQTEPINSNNNTANQGMPAGRRTNEPDQYTNNPTGNPGDRGGSNTPNPQDLQQPPAHDQGNDVITMGERVGNEAQQNNRPADDDTPIIPPRDAVTGDNDGAGTVNPVDDDQPPVRPVVPASAPADLSQLLTQAEELASRNELVRARELYNQALYHPQVGQAAPAIRRIMSGINETLIFSNAVVPNDPYTESHRVANGELLGTIAARCRVDWLLLARINGITDPKKVPAGRNIKIVHGPFHAVVDKSDHRLDLYVGEPNQLGQQMFVRSFPIGLGEYGSTPVGEWVVREGNKLINPSWRDERTGEFFAGNDPDNPIGKRWIGIRGLDENTKDLDGFGIHGTIDPESIGKNMSRGCIRMLSEDVELVYQMLSEGRSMVLIRD
ncbi:MAG: L,D-transpeptidase family protein [Planctomycetes bacterium]|nr:L,D-transpeptidase family protein [Planctomycetota bacterium]